MIELILVPLAAIWTAGAALALILCRAAARPTPSPVPVTTELRHDEAA